MLPRYFGQHPNALNGNVSPPSFATRRSDSMPNDHARLRGLRTLYNDLGLTQYQLRRLAQPPYTRACMHFFQQVHNHKMNIEEALQSLSSQSMAASNSENIPSPFAQYSNGQSRSMLSANLGVPLPQSQQVVPTVYGGTSGPIFMSNRPSVHTMEPAGSVNDLWALSLPTDNVFEVSTPASTIEYSPHSFSNHLPCEVMCVSHDQQRSASAQAALGYGSDQLPQTPCYRLNSPSVDLSPGHNHFTPQSDDWQQHHTSIKTEHANDSSTITTSPVLQRTESMSSSQQEWKFKQVGIPEIQKVKGPKTPCPKCLDAEFESPTEFRKHLVRNHEQPIKYICNHYRLVNGVAQYCKFSAWHLSYFKRHHTWIHSDECGPTLFPGCRREKMCQLPVRQRGCWLCPHLSNTVDEWVKHHLSRHRACSRTDMSRTCVMNSLLSHQDIAPWWQAQIKHLQIATKCNWNLGWSEEPEDVATLALIKCLETGYYKNIAIHTDKRACRGLAAAVMKATTKARLGTLPAYRLQVLRKELEEWKATSAVDFESDIDPDDCHEVDEDGGHDRIVSEHEVGDESADNIDNNDHDHEEDNDENIFTVDDIVVVADAFPQTLSSRYAGVRLSTRFRAPKRPAHSPPTSCAERCSTRARMGS